MTPFLPIAILMSINHKGFLANICILIGMTEIFMLIMSLILPVLRGADSPADTNIQFVLICSKYKGVKLLTLPPH